MSVNSRNSIQPNLFQLEQFGQPISPKHPVVILLHGRRQTTQDMQKLYEKLDISNYTVLAPIAPENTWYPRGFMREISDNQPQLNDALNYLDSLIVFLVESGIPLNQISLVGFSQGACIAMQYLKESMKPVRCCIGFTGGLFGPELELNIAGSAALNDVKIYLTGSQTDTWVPAQRVQDTAQYFTTCGANVDVKIFDSRDHLISDEEISQAREVLTSQELCYE
ncbi:alpha/beta hydrolase [Photobacterium sp. CCB-ST2H9]|uniref:alpha/beta hydrolase n=1 Tax=Photobacterium sp. CCB-ST2H9 TaxID=2912855 RepID=UPI0020041444|nr:dienelactone hydrolase family protein [Photobacterium sp. CCB-ST2H9]UTM59996.1 alpha/beta hydrolase [Photobacterium sp. CCB-ST2H9]